MLDQDDLWWTEDELPADEPSELLTTVRGYRTSKRPFSEDIEKDAGLRSILNRPEILSKAWWRSAHA